MSPGANRNGVRLKEARRCLGGRFGALADGARGDISSDSTGHARPPETGGDGIKGLAETRVTSDGGIVVFKYEALAECGVMGYTHAVVEIPHIIA